MAMEVFARAFAFTLLASHTGELLYDAMGYEKIRELLLYTPPRKRGGDLIDSV